MTVDNHTVVATWPSKPLKFIVKRKADNVITNRFGIHNRTMWWMGEGCLTVDRSEATVYTWDELSSDDKDSLKGSTNYVLIPVK